MRYSGRVPKGCGENQDASPHLRCLGTGKAGRGQLQLQKLYGRLRSSLKSVFIPKGNGNEGVRKAGGERWRITKVTRTRVLPIEVKFD